MPSCALLDCFVASTCCESNNEAWCCEIGRSCGNSVGQCIANPSTTSPQDASSGSPNASSVVIGVTVSVGLLLILAVALYFFIKYRRTQQQGKYQETATTTADQQQQEVQEREAKNLQEISP